MSYASVFGPIVDRGQIQDDVRATILAWVDTYLVAVEQRNNEAPRTWTRPRDWRLDSELRIYDEDVLPLLVVVAAGEDSEPVDEGDGTITSRWTVGVGAYLKAATRDELQTVTSRYGAAIATLVEHKAGDPATGFQLSQLASRPQQSFDEGARLTFDEQTLGVAYVTFLVQVDEARNRFGGPDEPFPAPIDPADQPPTDLPTGADLEEDGIHVTVRQP